MVFCAREHEQGLVPGKEGPRLFSAVCSNTPGIKLQVPLSEVEMLLSPFQSGWRSDAHSPHRREENKNDIKDESCVHQSAEEPISCWAQSL